MRLFDAHCHLQEASLAPALPRLMREAREAGLMALMCCATATRDWERCLEISLQWPEVLVSLGVHPWYAANQPEGWLPDLRRRVQGGNCAIGEIGLDYGAGRPSRAQQVAVFIAQLRLAAEIGVPVSVHCRKAWGDMLELLRREKGGGPGGVMHAYSGPPEFVAELEEMGFYLSFSGAITHDRNKRGPRSLAAVSDGRLLIETDCPAMLPAGARGDCSVPADIIAVLNAAARLRAQPAASVAELTCGNARRLFRAMLRGERQ